MEKNLHSEELNDHQLPEELKSLLSAHGITDETNNDTDEEKQRLAVEKWDTVVKDILGTQSHEPARRKRARHR